MTALHASVFGDRLPTQVEQSDATRLKQIMQRTKVATGSYKFQFKSSETGEPSEVFIDAALGDSLLEFLDIVARGQSVQIVPIEAELSTKQAAALLNISRPFLIKLLENGEIPYRKVGVHRRVKAAELFDYKQAQDALRASVLDKIIESSEADDLL